MQPSMQKHCFITMGYSLISKFDLDLRSKLTPTLFEVQGGRRFPLLLGR